MILDIKKIAKKITDDLGKEVKQCKQIPQLAIILVGNNPASEVYVKNKIEKCEEVGLRATLLRFETSITEEELKGKVQELNEDNDVTGVLIQSPLPAHIQAQAVFNAIDSAKDVDGFSSANITKLYSGDESGLMPGTPRGVMKILEEYFAGKKLEGKNAVVIGKSTIVGKPLSMMLMHAGVTVTMCHSKTADLSAHTRVADIVVVAAGKRCLVQRDMVKPGSIIIDVGINVEDEDDKRKLYGDCDTESIAEIADITPVPGGVGPMTIAMLLSNLILAHALQGKK